MCTMLAECSGLGGTGSQVGEADVTWLLAHRDTLLPPPGRAALLVSMFPPPSVAPGAAGHAISDHSRVMVEVLLWAEVWTERAARCPEDRAGMTLTWTLSHDTACPAPGAQIRQHRARQAGEQPV